MSFEAKWRLLARVGVRCYILISNVSGAVKVAPLQILQFPVVLPHKFQDAEKFNLQFPDFSEITETADKLRWLRYQKGLRQRDVADYAGIDRSTYVHYEEYGKDLYPPEHMEKIAQLFEVPVDTLLDDYNLFLRNGQGNQIKAIRMKLGLTQKQYADKLDVSLGNLKHWEQNRKQIFKSTWEKYFKQMQRQRPCLVVATSPHNHSSKRADRLLRLVCSFAMYYCCTFRCFTAASTSSSFCSVEQDSFWTVFSACSDWNFASSCPSSCRACFDFGKIRNTSMAALLSRAFSSSIYACVPAAM